MTVMSSILIITWNGRNLVEPCLRRALAQSLVEHEVVVVDNGSTDQTAEFVEARFPQVRVIRNPKNLGFAGGVNVGVRATSSPTVALVNQDAELDRLWLRRALDRLATDDRIAVVGSKILYPDRRTIQHAGGRVLEPLALTDHVGYRQFDRGQFEIPADADYVTGAAMLLRRDRFDQLDGFDERFFPAYFEEADFCRRARLAGYRVVYEPKAIAYHRESASTERDSAQYYRWIHTGRVRFVMKQRNSEELSTLYQRAELERISTLGSQIEAAALGVAYRTVLSEGPQPDWPGWNDPSAAERALRELAEYAEARAAGPVPDPLDIYLSGVRTQRVPQVPTLGFRRLTLRNAVARLREVWNDWPVSSYITPMVLQQRETNRWVFQALSELSARLANAADRVTEEAAARERLDEAVRRWDERDRRVLEARLTRDEEVLRSVDRDLTGIVRAIGAIDVRLRAVERLLEEQRAGAAEPQPAAGAPVSPVE